MSMKKNLGQRLQVVIYLQDEQTGEGEALRAQEAACGAIAQEKGYVVVSTLKDVGVDGREGLAGRPALATALGLCLGGQADVLLCYAMARLGPLAEQVRFLRRVSQAGVSVEAVREGQLTAPAASQQRRAAFEAGVAAERQRVADRLLAGRRKRGKFDGCGSGALPYGYHRALEGAIIVDDAAAAVVCLIFAARRRKETYRQIAEALNAAEIPAARGGAWQAAQVYRIVEQERLYRVGVRSWGNVIAEKPWPVILPAA